MMKNKDLIGHTSGYLRVVALDGVYDYAGQAASHWICFCSRCETHSVLVRKRLTSSLNDIRYDRCQSCRVGHCIICSTKIGGGNVGQLTCGGECFRLHDNYRSDQNLKNVAAKDPLFHSKKWSRHKALNK
jgi:hypothetical protein